MGDQLLAQEKNPKAKNILYSLHEPDVDCISKGKVRKRYDPGTKVCIASTKNECFVVGIRSYQGNPNDGNTRDNFLQQAEIISSVSAKQSPWIWAIGAGTIQM